MKKNILTTLLAVVLYFLCLGIGVLLGHLVDSTGNMFYAPAFSALVGGSVYMLLLAKVPRFGAITTLGLFMALFFLASKHGAGAFLPAIAYGFNRYNHDVTILATIIIILIIFTIQFLGDFLTKKLSHK